MIRTLVKNKTLKQTQKLLTAAKPHLQLATPPPVNKITDIETPQTLVGMDGSRQHSFHRQPQPDEAAFWEMMNDDIQLSAAKEGSIPKYRS